MKLNVERIELSNGMVVLLMENHALPTVSVNAIVRTGERWISDDQAGLASLAGEMLDEGTHTYTSQQIADLIESVGGELETIGGYATTGISIAALSGDLDLSLELTAELLRHAQFPEDRLALAVSRRLAEMQARQDEPQTVASDAFNEIIFAGTPQRRPLIGYEETITNITRADLLAHHRRFFVPHNIIIAVAGDFVAGAVTSKLRRLFADWRADEILQIPSVPEPRHQSKPVTRFIEKDKEQVSIYLGHLGIARANPDYHSIRVMDTILGDSPGFTSRIPRILRDEQGLAYTTYCHLARSAGLDPGRFVAFIGTAPENLTQAVAGLRAQIAGMTTTPPTDDEIEMAKEYLIGSYVFEFETNAQLAAFMLNAEIYQFGFDYPQQFPTEIRRVTAADVLRVARRYISPTRLTQVVVGPMTERQRNNQAGKQRD